MSISKKQQGAGVISTAKRQLLASLLADEGVELSQKISRRKTSAPAPLSYAQQQMWLLHQMEPESPAYNLPSAVRLTGPLDIRVLERSLNEIVRRHESLRTSFPLVGDQPVQSVSPASRLEICVIHLERLPAAAREAELQRLAADEARAPFDLSSGLLLRVKLLRESEQEHVILFTLHHIVSDAWSSGVFVREFIALYTAFSEGRPSPLEELPIQYADFAVWQRDWLRGDVFESHLKYWERRLEGASTLNLPTDRPRPAVRSDQGASYPITISKDLTDALNRISQAEGCTLYMTLLAAFSILLSRCSGQEDISVGAPVAGRRQIETEPLIGFFVNTIVMRSDLGGNPGFREFLRSVRKMALEAYAHQDLPFEMLVERLQPARNLGSTPLFQAMLALQTAPATPLRIPGLKLSPVGGGARTAKFELTLELGETADGLSGLFEYSADLFEPETVAHLSGHFQTLLKGIVETPDESVMDLPLLTPAQRRQMLHEWNGEGREYLKDQCVHELFEKQAEQRGDAAALVFEDQRLTYRQLNSSANQLAGYLRRKGIGPGKLVGVFLERSVEMIVTLLATLKAGAAYVPLDVAYPEERLRFMLEDAQVSLLATTDRLAERLPSDSRPVVRLDSDARRIAKESAESRAALVTPEHLAYVSYTSGSTGLPKGTAIPHRSVIGFMMEVDYARFDAQLRFLQYSSISWDALTLELWPALAHGGCCVLYKGWIPAPGELKEAIERHSVNTLWITSSLFNTIIDTAPEALSQVAQVMVGGEALSEPHMRKAQALLPETKFVNGYGPSECTVFTCCYPIPNPVEKNGRPIPIGRAIGDRMVYVLDRRMNPVPTGVSGELYIGGDSLAQGYLRRPELTAEKFTPNPYSRERGARLYRSGDLVRCLADGNLEFAGRVDDQVKIRGFRIELGEIEALLAAHPGVRECVLLVKQARPTEKRLAAYIVPAPEGQATAAGLRSYLKQRAPEYMIPSSLVLLQELPLTSHGKVDRKALLAMEESEGISDATLIAPRTPIEEMIAGAWRETLGIGPIGVTDNFFDLGGHSLAATQVASRLRKSFGIELPLRQIFEAPTVEELACAIEGALVQAGAPAAPPVRRAARDGKLPLSFAQQRLWFLDRLQPGATSYNLPAAVRLSGALDIRALEQALSEVLARHEVLRTVFAEVDGQPEQVIREAGPVEIPATDLSGIESAAREASLWELALAESQCPFDLAGGPLLRARILKLGPAEHVLLMTKHHIISDGWSMGILVREMTTLYQAFSEGRPSPLPELPIQYVDFAVWQRELLQGDVMNSQMEYWRKQLSGELPRLQLPLDHPAPSIYRYSGGRVSHRLSKSMTDGLKALSQQQGVSLFMTLLAAFKTLLYRYTNQTDLLVGAPIAGRNNAETEALIGFFINTLVLRSRFRGSQSFLDFLAQVREVSLGAYTHQDLPFEKLVEEIQPERNLSHSPLFQAMFVLQNNRLPTIELPNLRLASLAVPSDFSNFDLTLVVEELSQGEMAADFCYNRELFDVQTIDRLMNGFQTLLESIIADPQQPLARLPLLREAERRRILSEWSQAETTEIPELCVHQLFEARCADRPEATALVFEGEEISYLKLNRMANQLAHYLRRRGVGPEVRVGVSVERGVEMVVSVLAVLKAGGAYVPLDTAYPAERLVFMTENAGAQVVLTRFEATGDLPTHSALVVDLEAARAEIERESEENPVSGVRQGNLAYIIYTSGSTGRPKGVLIEHRGVCNLVKAQAMYFNVGPESRVLQFASLSFDASVSEMFVALAAGATLCLAARDSIMPGAALRRTLREQMITTVTLPPAVLGTTGPENLSHLETVISAGEACPAEVSAKWSEGRRFINAYGPTETSVCATMCDRFEPGKTPSIGRPMTNTEVYILSEGLEPAPVGAPGSLEVGGAGLARGYHLRPELTAEKFRPHPFSAEPGARVYQTGDIARFLPGGQIEFLGRSDKQVKVRGFRIELGEVENALEQHPAVEVAVAAVRESSNGDQRLVAYLVPRRRPQRPMDEGMQVQARELRRYLENRLPGHMIPSFFETLEALPLTPSGKIDYDALPAPGFTIAPGEGESLAPRTPVEEVVAGIWAEVLGVRRVGVEDNFFEMGGHSMLATQVISRTGAAFEIDAQLRWLFERPTVAALSERIEEAVRAGCGMEAPPLTAISRDRELPLSFAQQRLWFIDQLEPGNAAYNILKTFRVNGRLDIRALEQAWAALTERHESLRTSFPMVEGRAMQVIAGPTPVSLSVRDLTPLDPPQQAAEVRRLAEEESQYIFDLSAGPLARACLLRLKDEESFLFITLHHIISDGWSMEILGRELMILYNAYLQGRSSPLEKLPIQYADYAAWQREWLQAEALERQLAYWRQQLSEAAEALQLPFDYPPASVQDLRAGHQTIVLPPELDAALRALSRRQGVTLFMTLLAAYDILLHRYTGQDHILIGAPVAGRGRPETEALIGFFVNTLVLHTDLTGAPSFNELLSRVREVALGAYIHQDIPFEKLVEELQPERKPGRNPFFDVMINYAGATPASRQIETLQELSIDDSDVAEPSVPFPLALTVGDYGADLAITIRYQAPLFTEQRIASMLEQYRRLLEQIAERPEETIGSYSLRTASDRLLLPDPSIVLPEPPQQSVPEMFLARASETPGTVAVSQGGRIWTYEQTAGRACSLAKSLVADGLQPGEVVAVTGSRCFGLIVSMMAVFSGRGVLLVLDPALPAERKRLMLNEAGAKHLLYVGGLRTEDSWMPDGVTALKFVDAQTGSVDGDEKDTQGITKLERPNGDAPAYVFFTSGTTGAPKGILGLHKSLSHFLTWQRDTFEFGPLDRSGQLTGLSFDVVLRDIFTPLISGATLCLPDEENLAPEQILAWLERERITRLHLVPSLAQFWLANRPEGVTLRHLKSVFFAGEPLTDVLVRRWREAFPESGEIINLYGPTETTLAKCYFRTPADPAPGVQPVGRPIPQSQALVLDRENRLCGISETGEIVIRTPFRSAGYINAAADDLGRFFKNPFNEDETDLLYRTGDRGRYRPDGELEILGRIDQQVKIRGVRIEPGEIEAVLRSYTGVIDAVVVAREDRSGEKYLAAYVVFEESLKPSFEDQPMILEQLKRHAGGRLPQYMTPTAIVFLDRLPLTANGKLDRRALPAPELTVSDTEVEYTAPRTPVEEVLAEIWAETLGVERAGVYDDFFNLGGHSLLVTKAIFRIRAALNVELPVHMLFEQPTIAGLAHTVESLMQAADGGPRLPPIERSPRSGSLPVSSGQEGTLALARREGRPSYYSRMLRFTGPLNISSLERALSEVVRRHEILRTNFMTIDGQSLQVIDGARPLRLHLVDLSSCSQAEREDGMTALAEEQMQRPFDLAQDPLFRTTLVKLGENEHALLYTILHLICDLWSLRILNREMALLYRAYMRGQASPLPDLPVQYADFAIWERKWLQGGALETALDFWRRQLESAPTILPLPTDHERPRTRTFRGETEQLQLPDNLYISLKALCRRESATMYMALLAAFDVLLNRYTGQEDILVGTAVAGRPREEVENLIGQFVNLLVMRTKLHGDPTFRELLAQVREVTLKSYAHQLMPIETLIQELAPNPDPRYSPLVQVAFTMRHDEDRAATPAGLESSLQSLGTVRAPFDLLLAVDENPRGLFAAVTYNIDLFDRRTITGMMDHFQTLLGEIVEDGGRRISELSELKELNSRENCAI
jgi:amino acid adenylation domain-containing protein